MIIVLFIFLIGVKYVVLENRAKYYVCFICDFSGFVLILYTGRVIRYDKAIG